MRPAKSINSISNQQQFDRNSTESAQIQTTSKQNNGATNGNGCPTSPICRCRVMYLGSSVPHITKDGLQGIQEPLRELYPDSETLASGNAGIDSWLSVWSNGILIENVDENGREVKRFFKIDALHYCAAVKFVSSHPLMMQTSNHNQVLPKFLPLDSPHARAQSVDLNPPIFASILRRTTGVKVLECHAFICKREAAANALVRCCFHAYADTMYAKQIGTDVNNFSVDINNNRSGAQHYDSNVDRKQQFESQSMRSGRSRSIAALNEPDNISQNESRQNRTNHANKAVYQQQPDIMSLRSRRKSMNEGRIANCDSDKSPNLLLNNELLRQQQKFSKSMHQLNGNQQQLYDTARYQNERNQINDYNQSTSASCLNAPINRGPGNNQQQTQVPQSQPFYNPYASRVPSYPPQSLIDAANNGGTLKSIRSMAANSIASTLLRSKKHAKAMSMAQLNQDKMISFHQPHSQMATTMSGPLMMPPIPPMFLPNLPPHSIINGSQTMKVPSSRPIMPVMGKPINFESMTPKEMKKMLKKSAKFGIDPNKFGDSSLPMFSMGAPPPLHPMMHMPNPHSKSGTMVSQAMVPDIYGNDMPDIAQLHGLPFHPSMLQPVPLELDPNSHQIKPILVKPNPEFLKSKAGKKWLKQQKEFKKLLPPHLEGLPIIFGPPPIDHMEPAPIPSHGLQHQPNFIQAPPPPIPPHQGLPMMDSSGYYNPHPFYGQNGRASAASTLLRYSPQAKVAYDNYGGQNQDIEHLNHGQIMYSNGFVGQASQPRMLPVQKDYTCDNASLVYGNNDYGHDNQARSFLNGEARNFIDKHNDHMVEQSIISLDDENDYDDDKIEGDQSEYYNADSYNHEREVDTQSKRSKASTNGQNVNGNGVSNNNGHQEMGGYNHGQNREYDQANLLQSTSTDDQSSYSSGIYKKGHINERAFSYSIRQEHRSGNSTDGDYLKRDGIISETDERRMENQQQSNMFQNKCDENYYQTNNNTKQQNPVNELTTRLENQLKMKSFANSRTRGNM